MVTEFLFFTCLIKLSIFICTRRRNISLNLVTPPSFLFSSNFTKKFRFVTTKLSRFILKMTHLLQRSLLAPRHDLNGHFDGVPIEPITVPDDESLSPPRNSVKEEPLPSEGKLSLFSTLALCSDRSIRACTVGI